VAIRATGYHNVLENGRSRSRKARVIGVIVPRLDDFHVAVLTALGRVFERQNLHVLQSDYEGDYEEMEEKLRILRGYGVSGIVCSPVKSIQRGPRIGAIAKVPLVTFNNRCPSWGADHVGVDDRDAVRRAIEYLIDMNHSRIAIISGSTDTSTGFDRLAGYRDAIEQAGITERADFLLTEMWGSSELQAFDAARRLLESKDPPTAIFAGHYRVAYGLLRYIHDAALSVPDDVSIISFDDTELFRLHRPEITAIRQPVDRIASEIAVLLMRRMRTGPDVQPMSSVIDTEFILRHSVGKTSGSPRVSP
jgi:LacI family transcriptional regulator